MAGTSTKYGPSSIISATSTSAELASGFPVGMVSITVHNEENFHIPKSDFTPLRFFDSLMQSRFSLVIPFVQMPDGILSSLQEIGRMRSKSWPYRRLVLFFQFSQK